MLCGARRGGGGDDTTVVLVATFKFWPRQQAMKILASPTSDGNVCSFIAPSNPDMSHIFFMKENALQLMSWKGATNAMWLLLLPIMQQ